MTNSATVCIQDKNGKHWNTLCSADYTAPEIRNMQRHLQQAAKHPAQYQFLDLASAVILVDGEPYAPVFTSEDDELLKQLGA